MKQRTQFHSIVELHHVAERIYEQRLFHAEPVWCDRCGTFIERHTEDRFVDLGEHIDYGDCERARDERILAEAIQHGIDTYHRLAQMTPDELDAWLGIADDEIERTA